MAEIEIAPLTRGDLPRVAEIHAQAFATSAITGFGPGAVTRYYAWLLEGPHDAALVGAWNHGQLVGFCAAGVFRGAMNGFLRANRRYLAMQVLRHPGLLASPLIRDRLRQAVSITLRFSRLAQRTSKPAGAPQFGVLSIATSPAAEGTGVGRALMQEAEDRARSRGHARIVLTVHPENVRAVRFYERQGWQRTDASGSWNGAMHKLLT